MSNAHTLTRHRDIKAWVSARNGMPALIRAHTDYGHVRARLALRFGPAARPRDLPAVDQGASPVGWEAWLAELDRQGLALRVSEDGAEYEIIRRPRQLN